jgi:hypothetical protein
MPYDASDVIKLPKNVQEMNEHDRKMWVDVWNSSYAKHGSDSLSFKYANGVLKKRRSGETTSHPNEVIKEFLLESILEDINLEERIAESIGQRVVRK